MIVHRRMCRAVCFQGMCVVMCGVFVNAVTLSVRHSHRHLLGWGSGGIMHEEQGWQPALRTAVAHPNIAIVRPRGRHVAFRDWDTF